MYNIYIYIHIAFSSNLLTPICAGLARKLFSSTRTDDVILLQLFPLCNFMSM
jgi:hypothetical protein